MKMKLKKKIENKTMESRKLLQVMVMLQVITSWFFMTCLFNFFAVDFSIFMSHSFILLLDLF